MFFDIDGLLALQFGHGGDAVETPGAAKEMPKADPLQFGHGGDAVETANFAQALGGLGATSIRPRR